jgi:hypothetical protein
MFHSDFAALIHADGLYTGFEDLMCVKPGPQAFAPDARPLHLKLKRLGWIAKNQTTRGAYF